MRMLSTTIDLLQRKDIILEISQGHFACGLLSQGRGWLADHALRIVMRGGNSTLAAKAADTTRRASHFAPWPF